MNRRRVGGFDARVTRLTGMNGGRGRGPQLGWRATLGRGPWPVSGGAMKTRRSRNHLQKETMQNHTTTHLDMARIATQLKPRDWSKRFSLQG